MTKNDNSRANTVRKEKAILELLEESEITRENRKSTLPYLDAVPIEDLQELSGHFRGIAKIQRSVGNNELADENEERADELQMIIDRYD